MVSLILSILVLIAAYALRSKPLVAGLLAVLPVKILGTAAMMYESGDMMALKQAIGGMLIGQVLWGLALLFTYIWLSNRS